MKKWTAAFLAMVMFIALATSASAADAAKVKHGVNLRTGPGTSYKVVRMLNKGETIQVLSQVNANWLKVQTKSGQVGYISSDSKYTDYAGSSKSPILTTKADAIIATAKSLAGKVEYEFGKRDPQRFIFDCSSFTQYVFAQHGVQLKWGTRYQKNAGKAVSKANLQKGDLVFFSVDNTKEIGHVGIYIGNGEFIHNLENNNGPDVHINNLNTGYWKNHYISARRVL
jgi:cell wall-associated NlpC family hydrolase